MKVYLFIDQDKSTRSLQLSIGDGHGGYRICGPKYSGTSESLKIIELGQRDADEMRQYIDKAFPRKDTK